MTLGALLQGITIEGRAYAGGWWEWLTPFSLLTGASLVVAYALLGAAWLIWKTEGDLARARPPPRDLAAARLPARASARSAWRRRSSRPNITSAGSNGRACW